MNVSEKLEKEICRLENELLRAEVRCSPERISSLLAEGFFEFGSSGRVYHYAEGDVFDSSFAYHVENFKAKRLSRNCVLATYKAVKRDASGVMSESLRSSNWKRRRGIWKMVFHQGTPLNE